MTAGAYGPAAMSMFERIRAVLYGPPAADPTLWHEPPLLFGIWQTQGTLWPVRTIDGKRAYTNGKLWRRWNGARWEYQQDEETFEDQFGL